jgi:hypothetical protein
MITWRKIAITLIESVASARLVEPVGPVRGQAVHRFGEGGDPSWVIRIVDGSLAQVS